MLQKHWLNEAYLALLISQAYHRGDFTVFTVSFRSPVHPSYIHPTSHAHESVLMCLGLGLVRVLFRFSFPFTYTIYISFMRLELVCYVANATKYASVTMCVHMSVNFFSLSCLGFFSLHSKLLPFEQN